MTEETVPKFQRKPQSRLRGSPILLAASLFCEVRWPSTRRQGIQESHLRNVITRNRYFRLRWPLIFVAFAVFGKGRGKGAAKVCLKVVPGNFPAVKKREKGNRLQRGRGRVATYSGLRWRVFHPPISPHYQRAGKAQHFSCRVMVRRN